MKTRKIRRIAPLFWWVAVVAVFSAIVMLLWNALIPTIFGLTVINYWQALGLLVLARILFGGLGGRRGMKHGRMMHHHGMHGENPVHEKWMKMTPEERKKFVKERMKHAHGGPFGRRDFFRGGFDCNDNENSSKGNE